MMPGLPNGSTAVRIISQWVAPRARAPSLWAVGTCWKTSREIAVMIGSTMIARIRPAKASVLLALNPASPKNGIQPNTFDRPCWIGVKYWPAMVRPQKP